MRRAAARAAWASLVAAFVVLPLVAGAQVPSDPLRGARITQVEVVLLPPPADPQAARNLEGAVRKAFRVYPGDQYDVTRVDFGLSRVRGVPGVARATAKVEFADQQGLRLVVTADTSMAPRPVTFANRLRLVDDGEKLLKLQVSLKGAIPVSGNQWFGNGPALTQYSPYGRYTAGNGPNTAYDVAPKIGIAGIFPVVRGETPVYAYGHLSYLAPAIAGQANGTASAKFAHGVEDAYVGVVGGGRTAAGTAWQYNLSFGQQPYCIGGAMFLCQVASSSGERAGDFTWPRWTAKDFLKAQVRVNNDTADAFYFRPNDYPSTSTRIAGVNYNHDRGYGLSFGATWLAVVASDSKYYLADGSTLSREGLRAWQLRGAYAPAPGRGGPIVKLEYGRQTNADFEMAASAVAAEGGWWFGKARWAPSVTYRFTSTTGDDPASGSFERWDLLYSGGDIDTWVQGQLMKNIHYNSNVQMHRVMARARVKPTWRLTGSFSNFRANTLNNLGGVIATFATRDVGRELLFVSEHNLSRNMYVRLTQGTLWPGSGVRGVLSSPVSSPWLVGIVTLSIDY